MSEKSQADPSRIEKGNEVPDWIENVRRWRALPEARKLQLRMDAIPLDVAESMAFEGQPVSMERIRALLDRIKQEEVSTMEMEKPKEPPLSAAEQALVTEVVADGLSIQDKFRPEPLYKLTGKAHYDGDTVNEIRRAKESKPKADSP